MILIKFSSFVSMLVCFSAAYMNNVINARTDAINRENHEKNPNKHDIPTAQFYSLIVAGILQLAVLIYTIIVDR